MAAPVVDQAAFDGNFQGRITAFYASRLAMIFFILLTTIFLRQEVLGVTAIVQIYATLTATFLISLAQSAFWEISVKSRLFMPSLLLYDLLLTSYLVYLTGVDSSVFLFVYLFNIAFASVAYQLQGSLLVAVVSGLIYFFIYGANNEMDTIDAWYTLAWNELLFLLSALLCGQFMDELKKQKAMLATQKESIENLERLNNRLLNSLPVGVMLVGTSGNVENINQTANAILGADGQPAPGRKYYELFPDLRGIFEAWEQMTETQRLRFIFRSREDQPPHLSLRVVPLLTREGRERQHIIVFQDISKLQALEQKLEFESKLAATGELAAAIAHEIRNPLASISGSIELLSQGMNPKNEQEKKLANIALLEIRRLNRLVTDFLEFAKPKDYSGDDFPLAALVEEVSEAMRNRASRFPVNIRNDLPESLSAHANRERMKQVFINLFINSAEAAESGPVEITVSAKRAAEAQIEILVADNGPGIPPEVAGRIFDPFFTTKKDGTGLGLATIAQIMRAAKGDITLMSSAQGACFRLSVPASSSMEVANSAPEASHGG